MNPNKIILTEVICYAVLYILFNFIAFDMLLTPGGDAAGKGMESGFLSLFLIAMFFFIAIILTVINYFVIKRVKVRWIKLLAFIPLIISVVHILSLVCFVWK